MPNNEDGLESNEDGLESAKPDLQSTFKKPGGDPASPRLWEMLHDERVESRVKRRGWGRRRDGIECQDPAERQGLRMRRSGEARKKPGESDLGAHRDRGLGLPSA